MFFYNIVYRKFEKVLNFEILILTFYKQVCLRHLLFITPVVYSAVYVDLVFIFGFCDTQLVARQLAIGSPSSSVLDRGKW